MQRPDDGVAPGWWGTDGAWHDVDPASAAALRAAQRGDADRADDPVPTWFVGAGDEAALHSPCVVHLEDGTSVRSVGRLPADLPLGAHALVPDDGGPTTNLFVVAPRSPRAARQWGWSTQLYATRSRSSWGSGDLADLAELARWADASGAGLLAHNPLGATLPIAVQQPSPYSPVLAAFLVARLPAHRGRRVLGRRAGDRRPPRRGGSGRASTERHAADRTRRGLAAEGRCTRGAVGPGTRQRPLPTAARRRRGRLPVAQLRRVLPARGALRVRLVRLAGTVPPPRRRCGPPGRCGAARPGRVLGVGAARDRCAARCRCGCRRAADGRPPRRLRSRRLRRVGRPGPVGARVVGRRAAGRVQLARPGLGTPALRALAAARRRVPALDRHRAPHPAPRRRAARRPRDGAVPTLLDPARRRRPLRWLRAAVRYRAARPGRDRGGPRRCSADR